MLHLARHEGRDQARPEMARVWTGDDGATAERLEVPQAEFEVMPEGGCVHALEILDDLEHANLAVAADEGLEPAGHFIEFLRRESPFEFDLDRVGVVVFPVAQHGSRAFRVRSGVSALAGCGYLRNCVVPATVHGKLALIDL